MYARRHSTNIHSAIIEQGKILGFDLPTDGICSAYIRMLDLYTFAGQEKAFYYLIERICNSAELRARMTAFLNENRDPINKEEDTLRNINHLFRTLSLFMNSNKNKQMLPTPHDHLLRSSLKRFAINHNQHLSSLVNRGGIREMIETGNIVNLDEMKRYLASLTQFYQAYDKAVALQLKHTKTDPKRTLVIAEIFANNHLVSIRYVSTERKWQLRDSNLLFSKLMSPDELAIAIFNAFNFKSIDLKEKILTFSILFKTPNDNPCIQQTTELTEQLRTLHRYETNKKTHRDEDGMMLVHLAVKAGQEALLIAAIQDGADINSQDAEGNTALHLAILMQRDKLVERLIILGAAVDIENNSGLTATNWAAAHNNTEALEIFAKYRISLDETNKSGLSPLMTAAIIGARTTINKLIKLGVNINSTNHVGQSALHIAILEKNHTIAADLINAGIDTHTKTLQQNQAAHIAAENSERKTLSLLLRRGADMTSENIDGLTPFDVALVNDNYDCAALILAYSPKKMAKVYESPQKLGRKLVAGFITALQDIAPDEHEDLVRKTLSKSNALGLILSQTQSALSVNGTFRAKSLLDQIKNELTTTLQLDHQSQRILQPL